MAKDIPATTPTPARTSLTSADVARLAGVSRATVSFVLNDTQGHRVSEATRARVLDAAKQLGYVPHAAARSLRAGRSNLVLMPSSISAVGRLVSDWVDDLHSELDRHGYTAVLHAGRFTDPSTPPAPGPSCGLRPSSPSTATGSPRRPPSCCGAPGYGGCSPSRPTPYRACTPSASTTPASAPSPRST